MTELVSHTGQGLWNISQEWEWGGSKALTALGTRQEDEEALASLWNTTGRTQRARLPPELLLGRIPVPGITFCLAPDPTTPTTAPQSLRGPSGPSAVTEMQNKGCGFKNIINEDLQCPEEHLQADR